MLFRSVDRDPKCVPHKYANAYYLNHACPYTGDDAPANARVPNCVSDHFDLTVDSLTVVLIVTIDNVPKGGELLYNYGPKYWIDNRDPPADKNVIFCNCFACSKSPRKKWRISKTKRTVP